MGKLPSHLFVVRHGNRLDAADKKWHLTSPTPYDPPLTYGGFLQGRQVGNQIGSILEQIKMEEEASNQGPASTRKRRRFKIVIHSSPFLRCVQTSVGISSGLAQTSPDSIHNPSDIIVPGPAPKVLMDKQPKPFKSALLRLDSFLGEWLSPEYFEMITPPPGAGLMLGGAKADLLRREDYSAYTEFTPQEQQPSPTSSLWNASPTLRPQNPARSFSSDADDPLNISGLSSGLPPQSEEKKGYVPPRPMYAVSSGGKIPEGFVAHARDACVTVDYQWDSMRPPLDFGDGGKFGEEWTAMHTRFRGGLRKLVDWYSTAESPTESLAAPAKNDAGVVEDAQPEEEQVETVIVIVSHGAGCNALIGAITHQPVLMDVGLASITMAARKPGMEEAKLCATADPKDEFSVPSLRVDQMYDMRLSASTEHLQSSTSTPVSTRSSSAANPWNGGSGGYRGRTSTLGSLGGPVMSPFTFGDPLSTPGSRSTSASASMGNGNVFRRDSATNRSPRTSSMATTGIGGVTGGSASGNGSQGRNSPSMGLWAPVPSSLRLMDDGSGEEDLDDYDAMLPNFDQSQFKSAIPKAAEKQPPPARVASFPPDEPMSSRAPAVEPHVPQNSSRGPVFAGPIKLQTNLGPEKPAHEVTMNQLGGGLGGLWGVPLPPSDAERFRDLSHTKRRWTVNERI